MFGVANNYFLNVLFGDTPITLDPSQIREFTVVQDLNKFLPELRIRIADASGAYTHLIPFDQGMSKITITAGPDVTNPVGQTWVFDVYRRTPTSEAILTGEYDIVGLLAIPDLFSPLKSRSFNQNIDETIKEVCLDLDIEKYNISPSLAFTKTLLQANWSNAQFLQHIAENVASDDGDSNFRCWVSVQQSTQNTINFRSYSDLLNDGIKWQFAFGDSLYQDVFPIYNYEIVDNYKYLQSLGTNQQSYVYFDYETSKWVNETLNIADVESLTPYFMIDSNDSLTDHQYTELGMSNSLTEDFHGKVNSVYETRVNSLTKIWVTTSGNYTDANGNTFFDIRPGDLLQLEVPSDPSQAFNYQYSGYWLIERIILSFGSTLQMKMLLTRGGVTTSTQTTLLKATNIVQGS